MRKYLFIVFFVILFCSFFIFSNYDSYSSIEEEFVVNKPYFNVVRSLATKDSLEKAIEEDNGKLISKSWDNFILEVPKRVLRIREYKLEGLLHFTVEKYDLSLGLLTLDFNQEVKVDKDIFFVKIYLVSPNSKINLYNKTIEIKPLAEDSTNVFIKSDLKIVKFIPYFFKDYMNKKVDESNNKDLLKLKNNIIKIIENTDNRFKINVK